MSFVGLYMRLVSEADGFQILFYRSIGLCLIVGFVGCMRRQISPVLFLRSFDKNDVLMGLALSLAFICYVFAMLYTSVASTLLILSATPFMTASIGWVWIGERPKPVTWVAMFFAFLGIYLMVKEGHHLGNNFGNLMAVLSGFWFATMLVIARRSCKVDVLGGTFIGGLLCVVFGGCMTFLIGAGLAVLSSDLFIILVMGIFGIGIGIAFVTWGASYLPAAEVSILVLIESVLGPVWPWLLLGEAMTLSELLGGTLVLGSVVMFTLFTLKA